MIAMKSHLMRATVMFMLLGSVAFYATADECKFKKKNEPLSLTVPLTVSLPFDVASAPTGKVLYYKEASLAQLTGTHKVISGSCLEQIKKSIVGRISGSQRGQNTYETPVSGLGIKTSLIYEKPGHARKEWALPFNASLDGVTHGPIATDELKLKIELVKTGQFTESGALNLTLPSLIAFSDRSLVVNLVMRIAAANAHCAIQLATPQVDLPPLEAKALINKMPQADYPVGVSLQCMNTHKASISVEGVIEPTTPTIFSNILAEGAARGVGIEMLYDKNVMASLVSNEIVLPSQQANFSLPLTVRYAATGGKVASGKVKAQITLKINYL